MTAGSDSELLVLHAVRLTGFADHAVIARRFGIDPDQTAEVLLDAEARGWVQQAAFPGSTGWSLSEQGRAENQRQPAEELDRSTGSAAEVREVHAAFLPLNSRLQRACTDWQVRPTPVGRLEEDDHCDPSWDGAILDELTEIDFALAPLVRRLEDFLARFGGYDTRFDAALHRARAGENVWVDGIEVDSCHRVWFELHEDLVATLGIDRRSAA